MAIKLYLNSRPGRDGEVSVLLSINRNYRMIKVALDVAVDPAKWDKKRQLVTGSGSKDKNASLQIYKGTAEQLARNHKSDAELKEALRKMLGRGTKEKDHLIVDAFARFKDAKGAEVRGSTLQIYNALEKHLKAWLKPNAVVTEITPNWLNNFRVYLLKKGFQNSTINKLTTRAKGFLRWLEDERLIDRVPKTKTLQMPQNAPVYLASVELDRLMKLDLSEAQEGYRSARDLFLAGCFTGQRFSDLEGMQWHHLDLEGGWWNLPVKKKAVTVRVPLAAPLRSIIEARKGMRTPLPRLSNQKTNQFLKTICEQAKINEKITLQTLKGSNREEHTFEKWQLVSTHCARRTFVTLALQSGMPMNELLGFTHDDIRVLKKYAGRSEEERERHVNKAFGGYGNG